MTDWITLTNGGITARINPLGAELSSLTDAEGRELMTDADPAYWPRHAPLLFPIVGRLNGDVLRLDGKTYPMKQHGFARRMPFEVIEADGGQATFRLVDTEETRAAYPFAFRLEVRFWVSRSTLVTNVAIHNTGAAPLPASFGFHPAFAWPLPGGGDRDAHRIVFGAEEIRHVDRLEDGLIHGRRELPFDGRTLPLSDALFAEDALIWRRVFSDRVFYADEARLRLVVDFHHTPDLGIWSKPGARFVCIEPWHGHADHADFAGEFRDKPGVFEVRPGGVKRIRMSVTVPH